MFIQSFYADMFLKSCTNFGDNDKNDPHWFPCDLSKHQVKKKQKMFNVACQRLKCEIHENLRLK